MAGLASAGTKTATGDPDVFDYSEDFETFNVGVQPSDSWYTLTSHGTGSSGVVSSPAQGSRSYNVDPNAGGILMRGFQHSEGNMCLRQSQLEFKAWKVDSLTGTPISRFSLLPDGSTPNGDEGVFIKLQEVTLFGLDPLLATVELRNATGVIDSGNLLVQGDGRTVAEWQTFVIDVIDCGGNANIVVSHTETGNDVTLQGNLGHDDLNHFAFGSLDVNGDDALLYVDDLEFTGVELVILDTDGDGVPDAGDNCPNTANPAQTDTDMDGIGDACESDTDMDGVLDDVDNCPSIANPNQSDFNRDGVGDACELSPSGAALYFEDFEDDTATSAPPGNALEDPVDSWYTFTKTGAAFTSHHVCAAGSSAAKCSGSEQGNPGQYFQFEGGNPSFKKFYFDGFDFCQMDTVAFDLKGSYSGGQTTVDYGLFEAGSSVIGFDSVMAFRFNSGQWLTYTGPDSGAHDSDGPFTTNNGIWTRFSISNIDCDNGSATFTHTASGYSYTSGPVGAIAGPLVFGARMSGGSASNPALIDNIEVVAKSELQRARLPFNNIVGFDVDPIGTDALVVRYDGGDMVQGVNPSSMTLAGIAVDTNCGIIDGVQALKGGKFDILSARRSGTLTATFESQNHYLVCDPGDQTNVDEVHIRSPSLQQFAICSFCDDTWVDGEGVNGQINVDDDSSQLSMGHMLPPFATINDERDGLNDHAALGWAYTQQETGRVSYVIYNMVDDEPDQSAFAHAEFAGAGNVAFDSCATLNYADNDGTYFGAYSHGDDYFETYNAVKGTFMAVHPDVQSKVWTVDVDAQRATKPLYGDAAFYLLPELIPRYAISNAAAGQKGVDCVGDYIAWVADYDDVFVVERIGAGGPSGPVFTVDNVSSKQRGVAMVGNNLCSDKLCLMGAYINGTAIQYWRYNPDTDVYQETCTTQLPTGEIFKDMEMSRNGQYLFFATNAAVYKETSQACTTVSVYEDPDPDNPFGCGFCDEDGDGIANGRDNSPNDADCDDDDIIDGEDPDSDCNGVTCNGITGKCSATQDPVGNGFGNGDFGGFIGQGQDSFAFLFGGDATMGGIVMCIILILGFASVGSIIGSKRSGTNQLALGTAVGAGLGFILCIIAGVLPPVITFLLIVALGGAVFMKSRGGRG